MKMTLTNTGRQLKVLGLVLALPILLSLSGCTTSNDSGLSKGERVDDRATSSRVEDALSSDPLYKFGGVNVETYKGTVQLSGFVTAPEQKSRAADIAKSVQGVRAVANNITVREPNAAVKEPVVTSAPMSP